MCISNKRRESGPDILHKNLVFFMSKAGFKRQICVCVRISLKRNEKRTVSRGFIPIPGLDWFRYNNHILNYEIREVRL